VPSLVFTAPRGGRVRVNVFEQRILPQLCRWANVPVTTRFHTTRHTFATVLLHAGIELAEVSKWLGHASTATTELHYKHWIRDTRRDAAIGQLVDAAWRVGQ
jgi:integrase